MDPIWQWIVLLGLALLLLTYLVIEPPPPSPRKTYRDQEAQTTSTYSSEQFQAARHQAWVDAFARTTRW